MSQVIERTVTAYCNDKRAPRFNVIHETHSRNGKNIVRPMVLRYSLDKPRNEPISAKETLQ